MNKKKNAQWAFIFEQFGKENLREMLFKAAIHKDEEGRTIIEFDGEQAMNITEHVAEMESDLNR
jgi:hypothetical protein